MPNQEVELDPVLHITADAIGQPGQRVFYIQGQSSETVITLLVEKIQLQSLVTGIQQFLKEIRAEWNKVTWTGRKEVISGTIAVVIISVAISIFLWLIDASLSQAVKLVLGVG